MKALKNYGTLSTSGSQVRHIVLAFSDHYVKGKVFSLVVIGALELQAAYLSPVEVPPAVQTP